jgi:tetratricopeptide (TPR) repeat protein
MPSEQEMLARRHAIAYLEIAEELDAGFNVERDPVWTSRSRAELDNSRAALEWALVRRGDVTVGQRLVGALRMVWIALAPLEGCRWIDLALSLIDEATPANVVARIRHARALAASRLSETETEFTISQKALALYRDLGDELGIALCQTQLGSALRRLGRAEDAESVLLEALARLRHLDARRALAYTLRVISHVYAGNGDFSSARRHLAESVAIYKGFEAYRMAAFAISSDLAPVELTAGNAELALGHASDALPILKACNDMHSIADVLNIMSACLVSLDRYDAAEAHARESLILSSELNYSFGVVASLHRLAAVSALRTQGACEPGLESCARGAVVFGFVDARFADLGSPRETFDRQEYERALAALRGSIGPNQLAKLMNEGATMSEEQAVNEALGDDV